MSYRIMVWLSLLGLFVSGARAFGTTKEPKDLEEKKELRTISAGPICCKALIATCLSCANGQTVEEYCEANPRTSGCPDPRVCCRAMTATCLSCTAGQTVDEYCEANPTTSGCPDPRVCCRAMTANCLSCTAGQTVEEYCEANPRTSGCPDPPPVCCRAMTATCLSCTAGQTVEEYCKANPTTLGCPESTDCTGGREWQTCGSACTPTCDDPNPMCTRQCVAKCGCPSDKPIWHNERCVEQCPGVQVLDGGKGNFEATCVHPDSTTTTLPFSGGTRAIAAQCCEADGTCRRFVDSNDSEGCIAGHAMSGGVTAMTYREAESKCGELGLTMCTQSCKGKGCWYNGYPVWSGVECALP